MRKAFRAAQFLSNIATVLIAILFSIVVVRQYLMPTSDFKPNLATQRPANSAPLNESKASPQTPVGKAVPIEGVNWKDNNKTLVLYMSTKCRFCKESSPFYEKLIKEAKSKNVKFVAVLPQGIEEAKEYFKNENLDVTEIHNTSLSSIGVVATPILLLVNDQGVVSEYWRGKLRADKENEVIAKLNG